MPLTNGLQYSEAPDRPDLIKDRRVLWDTNIYPCVAISFNIIMRMRVELGWWMTRELRKGSD